jgi:hypothetical protein
MMAVPKAETCSKQYNWQNLICDRRTVLCFCSQFCLLSHWECSLGDLVLNEESAGVKIT